MANVELHELTTSEQLSSSDVIAEQREDSGLWLTRKVTLNALGLFLNNVLNFASQLQTTNKTIIGAINEVRQSGGGASELNELDDVSITNPSDGQILKYDATNHVWKNVDPEYSLKPCSITVVKSTDATTVTIGVVDASNNSLYSKVVQMDSLWGDFDTITETFTVDGIVNTITMYGDGVSSDTQQNWLHITLNELSYDVGNTARNPSYSLNLSIASSVKGEKQAFTVLTGTLQAGQTTITFSDPSIDSDSFIDVYAPVWYSSIVADDVNHEVTITFPVQASDITVKVRIS